MVLVGSEWFLLVLKVLYFSCLSKCVMSRTWKLVRTFASAFKELVTMRGAVVFRVAPKKTPMALYFSFSVWKVSFTLNLNLRKE